MQAMISDSPIRVYGRGSSIQYIYAIFRREHGLWEDETVGVACDDDDTRSMHNVCKDHRDGDIVYSKGANAKMGESKERSMNL